MKKLFVLTVALFFISASGAAIARTQAWVAGYALFAEPLDYANSGIEWRVDQTNKLMTIVYTLKGAVPNKLYQVGVLLRKPNCHLTFGNYPTGGCTRRVYQGVIRWARNAEFGVVTTDMFGNGTFRVTVGPIASGRYAVKFFARDGAGQKLIGGRTDTVYECFQSPGPFGTFTTVLIH